MCHMLRNRWSMTSGKICRTPIMSASTASTFARNITATAKTVSAAKVGGFDFLSRDLLLIISAVSSACALITFILLIIFRSEHFVSPAFSRIPVLIEAALVTVVVVGLQVASYFIYGAVNPHPAFSVLLIAVTCFFFIAVSYVTCGALWTSEGASRGVLSEKKVVHVFACILCVSLLVVLLVESSLQAAAGFLGFGTVSLTTASFFVVGTALLLSKRDPPADNDLIVSEFDSTDDLPSRTGDDLPSRTTSV